MTDIMKLIERLRTWKAPSFIPVEGHPMLEAADAIEALQAENERLKLSAKYAEHIDATPENQRETMLYDAITERDQLQAKLDELQRQEPVKFLADATRFKTTMLANGRVLINDLPRELAGRWVAFVAAENDCHLKLAAPKAPEEQEPREQRADWLPIANALDHAVRELGRTKEASAHDWNTAVHVFEFARATTCTCCNSHMQWPAAYRCLDCKAVLCEACAPIHFGPGHSKRAAEAHKGN